MHNIKFRGWDSENKKMVYEGFAIDHKGEIIDSWDEATECPDIIMQFTGLHDKNGKDIYEGDIIALIRPEIPGKQTEFGKGTVYLGYYYDDDNEIGSNAWGFFLKGHHGYVRDDGRKDQYDRERNIYAFTSWEVIGNTYEHKMLVEKEK